MSSNSNFEVPSSITNSISTYNSNLDNLISNLTIRSLTSSIVQIPTSDNEYHGVATARLITSTGEEFTGFGEAYAGKDIPKNMVLRVADMIAKTDACVTASISQVKRTFEGSKGNYQQNKYDKKYPNNSPNSYTNKPISDGQIKYINGLARKNGKSGDEISMERFNTSVNKLDYKQARSLIEELK